MTDEQCARTRTQELALKTDENTTDDTVAANVHETGNDDATGSGDEEIPLTLITIRPGNSSNMSPDLKAALKAAEESLMETVLASHDPENRRRAAEGLERVVKDWEKEHGVITEEEIALAQSRMRR
ncbi:MAG: hypothetical protein OXI96_10215 [Acidimicrobiaceae bacterium]|nr:hypothetical protein [Acidimicrobiaceae bacterium]